MRGLALTWRTAWEEAWANRRGLWMQVAVMVLNDIVWVIFWVIFFGQVGTVRGWEVDELMVLLAVLTASAGIVLGLFHNARRLGELAATGGLDAALSLPVPTLPYLLGRKVDTTHLGDLLFGVGLFAAFGDPTPRRAALFVFGVACSVLVFTGFLVLMGSLGFFVGRNEAGDLGFQALVLFASYPVDVFAGAAKVFLYVVVPAGFVSAAPARLVDRFDPVWAVAMAGVAITFAGAGWLVFDAGLRRYTSGAVWTDA